MNNNTKQIVDYIKLLEDIIKSIDMIDKNTVATPSMVEPEWWLDMMEIQRKAIASKMSHQNERFEEN